MFFLLFKKKKRISPVNKIQLIMVGFEILVDAGVVNAGLQKKQGLAHFAEELFTKSEDCLAHEVR